MTSYATVHETTTMPTKDVTAKSTTSNDTIITTGTATTTSIPTPTPTISSNAVSALPSGINQNNLFVNIVKQKQQQTTTITTTVTATTEQTKTPTSPSRSSHSSSTSLNYNIVPDHIKKLTERNEDFDCDFLSDEGEKADSTPENIKKIDDIINAEQEKYHITSSSTPMIPNTALTKQNTNIKSTNSPILCGKRESNYRIGLAAAVDDLNTEFNISHSQRCEKGKIIKPNLSNIHDNNDDTNYTKLNEKHVDDSCALDTTTPTGESSIIQKQSYAFTIDNFNKTECDPALAAAKYKNMLERFHNRHRRGASMSKIENENENINKEIENPIGMSTSVSSSTFRNSRNSNRKTGELGEASLQGSYHEGFTGIAPQSATPKVKLRIRDRSTSRIRDASKRHSWSPRSSTQELMQQSQKQHLTEHNSSLKASPPEVINVKKINKIKPTSAPITKGINKTMSNGTQFIPRSTVMQMALQKVDFLCAQPPLDDFKHLDVNRDDLSETGTYTLDGDNYTEEQKDYMNIDRSKRKCEGKLQKPLDLNLASYNTQDQQPTQINRTGNVLEVNYYHDTISDANTSVSNEEQQYSPYLKPKSIRSNKKNFMDVKSSVFEYDVTSNHLEEAEDVGCFTSVTASGVLAKQSALDRRPKLSRRNSLSTSQIDSSEYISNERNLANSSVAAYSAGGFTDHQKAEYRLNGTINQKDARQTKFALTRNLIESPTELKTAVASTAYSKISETEALKTAQTKNDWIQEWARNARARSLASENIRNSHDFNERNQQQDSMTRSYTCASDTDGRGDDTSVGLTDDSVYNKQYSLAKFNRILAERLRLSADCDYSKDSDILAQSNQDLSSSKPPKSPTKIPSPLHSIGRARSASRTRSSFPQQDDSNDYLQKTSAAITYLQQSLSRKSSLKSPTHLSPRGQVVRSHGHGHTILYSPDESSPHHSFESSTASYGYQRSPMHRRNLTNDPYVHLTPASLMTSSVNEQQLQLITSGDYILRQIRLRKNSLDGNILSPVSTKREIDIQNPDNNQQQLHRSNSFSTKIATKQQQHSRAVRPQFDNIYTPPAARQNYTLSKACDDYEPTNSISTSTIILKKSASSNSFRQVYSDYDDNLQYYINDEDDVEEEYYSSELEDNVNDQSHNDNYYQDEVADARTRSVPLTNTRLNKALLMRIERSKQKVAGVKALFAPVQKSTTVANTAGVIACPNTPELPRRGVKGDCRRIDNKNIRQSMPRDISLNRLASQVPNSLASAKKQLLQTASGVSPATTATKTQCPHRAQPRYMDISKYKPAQGNAFLRKNDARSTLKTSTTLSESVKRSPSSSGLSRVDPVRFSNRSIKTGNVSGPNVSSRASSAIRKDTVTKQKEIEMALWKRRSTYDPMKAAAEDRRKKEQAKKQTVDKDDGDMHYERPSRSHVRRRYL